MQVKVTLKVGQFMFSRGFSLIRGKTETLNTDDLDYTDLTLLIQKIRIEQVESNVSADRLLEIADSIRPEGTRDRFEEFRKVKPEIIEVELEENKEDAESEAEGAPEDKKKQLKKFSDIELIYRKKVYDNPVTIAVKNLKAMAAKDQVEGFFEYMLQMEESEKNRPSVVKAIKAILQ